MWVLELDLFMSLWIVDWSFYYYLLRCYCLFLSARVLWWMDCGCMTLNFSSKQDLDTFSFFNSS